MTEKNDVSQPDMTVDASKRAALRKLGLAVGAAPAVVMLLAPSASRAEFVPASCVDKRPCRPVRKSAATITKPEL